MATKNKNTLTILSKIKKIKRRNLAIFLVVLILALVLFLLKNQFIVATVNNQPIWRLTLIKELEKQAGRQALDSIITRTLILQEAKKQNLTVSQDEVNQEIEEIEKGLTQQGQDFNQLLEIQGLTRKDLEEQIRIQKLVEKMVGKEIQVSDEEIDEFIKENKESLPQDTDSEEIKETVKDQLRNQKLNEKTREWIENLHENAKINYF